MNDMRRGMINAVIHGDYEKVDKLVNEDKKLVNSYSEDGRTRLHLAAYFGYK